MISLPFIRIIRICKTIQVFDNVPTHRAFVRLKRTGCVILTKSHEIMIIDVAAKKL